MGVVDELLRAREAYERRDWVTAYEELSALDPADTDPGAFAILATVAFLRGRHNDCVQALQRAHRAHLDVGDRLGAVRCAFWLGFVLTMNGEAAVGSGWGARARRQLEDDGADVVEWGYLRILDMFQHVLSAQFEAAFEDASAVEEYGRRFDDPDLVAMGLVGQGRLLIYAGQVPDGLARFDEAMTALAGGEVSAVFAGHVYCTMIEGCQEISDLGRVAEWTAALTAWCESQEGLVAFTGQCAVHRGQIMRLHGAYDEALEELERAVERYVEAGTSAAAGLTFRERGDVLRILGAFADAEAAYEQALGFGHDPQPGLALLWLARGDIPEALAAARRLEAEPRGPVQRVLILPALVEIHLAAGDADAAAAASSELAGIAESFGCTGLRAMASASAAAVALARGDGADALAAARQALREWSDAGAPYESARCRVQVGRALRLLGDERSAASELEAARQTFAKLGAVPAEQEVAALLSPPVRKVAGGLSPRELEVLRLVAEGMSNQQIADVLVLSEKTVARHLSNIFTKLDVSSRTAAAAYAFQHDLV